MRSRLADAVYRVLLLAFPAGVRRELGEEMRTMFHDHRNTARGRPLALGRLWIAAAWDALFHGFAWRLSSLMRAFRHDLKHALRLLVRQPGLTVVAVVTLALGIGANAAIFSAVDAVLLRPLPWPEPDRMVMIWEKRPEEGIMDNHVSPADYVDWSRSATSFSAMSGYTTNSADLTGEGTPERFVAGLVSSSFFDIFGAKVIAGRVFGKDEEVVGRHRVVVLSHSLWTERFGSDRGVIGRKVVLNGIPHEVIGVVEPFEFVDKDVRLWAPLAVTGGAEPPPRASHMLSVYARLNPGVSVERARAEMDAIGQRLSRDFPETNRRHGSHVVPLRGELVAPVRTGLLLLLAAVGFVLLIACVNVANLLLARAVSRRREIAVRAALGAGRLRLASQGLTESLVLAVAGGLAGVFVAQWSLDALPHLMPDTHLAVGLDRLRIDARVIGFAALLTFATGALFGMLPAWHLSRQDLNQGLRDGGRSIAGGRRALRAGLVVAEVALASLLLVGAGLALRSFRTIVAADPGIRSSGVMTALVTLPNARYPALERRIATFDAIEARLASIPGVRSTGATSLLPMTGMNARRGISIQGREMSDGPTRAHPRGVTPGYFQTMGIRVVRGRGFTAQDDDRAPLVTVINEEAARRFWPGASPIGAKLRLNGEGEDWREIVGVVANVRHWGLADPVEPELYMPIRQPQYNWDGMVFVVSGPLGPESLAPDIRSAVRAVDPDLVVSRVRTMADVEAASVQPQRVTMLLLAAFAGVALVLAAAGIYGVMAHLVSLRTSEIGIRMTLGARPRDVLRQILGEAVAQAAAGLVIGLAAAVVLMRSFRAMLYEVSPADPATLAGVALVLLASALLACYVPARRAMKVDPVSALRAE